MADIELVIKIPEETYNNIQSLDWKNAGRWFSEDWTAIHNGTPLVDYLVELKAEIIKAMVDYDGTDATTVDCAALDIIDKRTGRKFKEI